MIKENNYDKRMKIYHLGNWQSYTGVWLGIVWLLKLTGHIQSLHNELAFISSYWKRDVTLHSGPLCVKCHQVSVNELLHLYL